MSALSAAATYSASFLGSYMDPAAKGETQSVGYELEQSAAALYKLSQKRINASLTKGVPHENAQLRRDTARAVMWLKINPDPRLFTSGVSNAIMKNASDQLISVQYGLPKYMSPTLQSAAEITLRAAARVQAIHFGLAKALDTERSRKWRDDGLSLLFHHIELAAGVRGVADSLSTAALSDITNAASETLSKQTYALNMQKVQWEKEQQDRAIQNANDNAMGSIFGNLLSGVASGFMMP